MEFDILYAYAVFDTGLLWIFCDIYKVLHMGYSQISVDFSYK